MRLDKVYNTLGIFKANSSSFSIASIVSEVTNVRLQNILHMGTGGSDVSTTPIASNAISYQPYWDYLATQSLCHQCQSGFHEQAGLHVCAVNLCSHTFITNQVAKASILQVSDLR